MSQPLLLLFDFFPVQKIHLLKHNLLTFRKLNKNEEFPSSPLEDEKCAYNMKQNRLKSSLIRYQNLQNASDKIS